MRAEATPSELLGLAVDLARRAAAVHAAGRLEALRVDEKGASPFNLVTQVDRQAERVIVDGIAEQRPDDSVVAEEGGVKMGSSGVRWIVDPLDGTANYVYGYPAYAVSIGVELDGVPVAGVVFDTARGVLFTGGRDLRAEANGRPIRASEHVDPATAMLSTGFSFDPALRGTQAAILARMLPLVRDVRRSGAASIDLCAVATGAVDAYYEGALAPWDVAGGSVVVASAGAVVLRGVVDGHPGVGVLAGNALLLERLTPMLREAGFELRPD